MKLIQSPLGVAPARSRISVSAEPMKVLGEWSSLCLALRVQVPFQDTGTMDRAFAEAMGKAKVAIDLTLSSGARIALRQPRPAWSMHGKILARDELSACAITPCNADLPVGVQVRSVSVSSDVPLAVQGIHWTSEARDSCRAQHDPTGSVE